MICLTAGLSTPSCRPAPPPASNPRFPAANPPLRIPAPNFRKPSRRRPAKCLRYFLRGDIMRWLWGRGSVGRAMRSQRIGQGFESPRLHHHKQTASRKRCRLLMAAKPSWERTCAQHYVKQRAPLLSHFSNQRVLLYVRAGSAAAQPTLSPFPAARSVSDIPHKRAASSSSYPYGEVPLVFTRGASHPWLT